MSPLESVGNQHGARGATAVQPQGLEQGAHLPAQIGESPEPSITAWLQPLGPASALHLRGRMEKVVVITSVTSLGGGYIRGEGACHHQDPQKPWMVATAFEE